MKLTRTFIFLASSALFCASGSALGSSGDRPAENDSRLLAEAFWSESCGGYCAYIQKSRTGYVLVAHDPVSGDLLTALTLDVAADETILGGSGTSLSFDVDSGSSTTAFEPQPPSGGTGTVHVDPTVFDGQGNAVAVVTVTFTFQNYDLVNVTSTRHDLDPP